MQLLDLVVDLGAEPSISTQINGAFGITGRTGVCRPATRNSKAAFNAAAEKAQAASLEGIIRASDSSSKTYDINVNTAVDLSKGWPAPEVRASGPPRETMLRRFTQDISQQLSSMSRIDRDSNTQNSSQHGSDTETLADQLRKASLGDDEDEAREGKFDRCLETVQALGCGEGDLNEVCTQSTLNPGNSTYSNYRLFQTRAICDTNSLEFT
jgi:hypothetical protein